MGTRLSQCWADPFQVVPAVTAHYWKEAQKLVGKGYFNLGFKLTIKGVEHFVFSRRRSCLNPRRAAASCQTMQRRPPRSLRSLLRGQKSSRC